MPESTGGSSPTRESEAFRGTQPGNQDTRNWGTGVGKPNERERQEGSRGGNWDDRAADKAREIGEDAKSLGNRMKEKAKDVAQTVSDKAKDVAEKAKDMAHTAGERVDDARTSVGEGLESLGTRVREGGSSASTTVGAKLEAAGHYLQEHDFSSMANSMRDVVRRHPVQSVFIGIGLGFILAKATRGRN